MALAIACAAAFSGAAPRHPSATIPSQAQAPSQTQAAGAPAAGGLEIVENGGYPELRVDGKPFFIHSAAFFYYRIPVDQWEHLLRVYRSYGINTIDLYIPWNWHEPKEGEIDFDGHTNPRRNLRALLAMIESANLRLIARPGPEIGNEWKHGGYPGWLLERPEYKMDPIDWIEGRYAPLDNLMASDAEAAAEGWLANPTHMEKSREWLTAVAKELAKYSARRIVHFEKDEKSAGPRDVSGPLLFVQLGDDFALGRSNRVGPNFWRYVESLRGAVEAGGVTVPVFINPTDMRVSAGGSNRERPIGVMGQWYLERRPENSGGVRRFTASDAAEVEFFTEELKTQPAFPPVMIEYQAGWYTPGDDDGPMASPPENTLLSSRLLIANGIHGINYFPLQDTYSPAGYSVPWANRSYRWDAALAPDGEQQPRMHAVIRNMEILAAVGAAARGFAQTRGLRNYLSDGRLSAGAAGARGYFGGVNGRDANRAAGGYGDAFERAARPGISACGAALAKCGYFAAGVRSGQATISAFGEGAGRDRGVRAARRDACGVSAEAARERD